MLPNGISGMYSTPDRVRKFAALAARLCGEEQEFRSLKSADGDCLFGMVTSDASTPYMLLQRSGEHGLAARDGFFFTSSRMGDHPSSLHAPDIRLPDEANGMVAVASWDGRSLRLLTDAWSSIPLYYRPLPGGWAFASQLRLLLELPGMATPDYDERGVAQFLCWHTILDGSTLYRDIRKLRGAELLEVAAGETREKRYWPGRVVPSTSNDAIDVTVDAFEQSVRRTRDALPGRHAAALSGGMDSRVICAVLGSVADMPAITHARAMGHDARLAIRAAKLLGFRHVMTRIDETFSLDAQQHFNETLQGSNGMLPAYNAHLPFVYRAACRQTDVLWDGIISTLEGRWTLRAGTQGIRNKEDFATRLWDVMYIPGLVDANSWLEAEKVHEIARSVLNELVHDPADSASPGCAADEFNMRWRLPNHGVDAGLLQNHYVRFVSPYLDLEYVAAVAAVPEAARWRQETQYATLRRFSPALLRLPRSYTDIRTIPARNIYVQLLPVAVQRLLLDRLRSMVPSAFHPLLDLRKTSMPYDDILRALTDEATASPTAFEINNGLFDTERLLLTGRSDSPLALRAWLPTLLHPDGPLRSPLP